MTKTLSNVEIIKEVVAALEADTEHEYSIDFDKMLNTLDIGRQDEAEPVDLENIINNFKQSQEII